MRVVELLGDDAASRSRAVAFVTAVESAEGSRPLSDLLWADLRRDEHPAPVVAIAADESGPIAMAQMSHANETWSLEAFARADVPDAATVMLDAAETALDRRRAAGAGTVVWWVDDPTDLHRHFAAAQGLAPTRALHEMRRPLPHEQHATVETRAFRPGVDDAAWLAVNNRAFADHAEQGGWTLDTLAARMDEPWFDPAGFRLHEVDGRLAAFCWTKLHAGTDTTPPLGEIYVIAVDPDFHGRGLGKQLTLAGLDSISARGVELANLYVDADNDAAVGLYERLGFSIHRTRRAFVGELTPQPDHEEDT